MRTEILLIAMLIAIVACGPAPTAQTPDAPAAPQPTREEQSAPPGATPAANYNKDVQELLDKTKKVKSYTFYYVDSTVQLQSDQWFVKGDKAVVRLYQPNYWNRDEWVDTVYLDFAEKTAIGYCETWQQVRCADNNRPFQIVFAPFDKRLPTTWLAQIPPEAKVVGGETIDDRFLTKIQWEQGGRTYSIWLDNTFGVPIKVRIEGTGAEEEYYYKDMAFNAVRDEMLAHQYVKRG